MKPPARTVYTLQSIAQKLKHLGCSEGFQPETLTGTGQKEACYGDAASSGQVGSYVSKENTASSFCYFGTSQCQKLKTTCSLQKPGEDKGCF